MDLVDTRPAIDDPGAVDEHRQRPELANRLVKQSLDLILLADVRADEGMATASGERGRSTWARLGMRYLPPAESMRTFDRLMRNDMTHAVVTDTDWLLFGKQFRPCPPSLAELLRTPSAASQPEASPAQLIDGRAGAPRPEFLQLVLKEVMQELGFEDEIDIDQPLNELGLDSLMAVRLSTRLQTALGVSVPVAALIKGPSVRELVRALHETRGTDRTTLSPAEPPPPAPPPAVPRAGVGGDITLRTAPASPRSELLEQVLKEVMQELGFEDEIDVDQPLNELGVDSLMAVRLATRLQTALALSVPVMNLVKGPSVRELVQGLSVQGTPLRPASSPVLSRSAETPQSRTLPSAPARPEATRTSISSGGGWLVFPRPRPSASIRLLCFPFAGGGATVYRPWVEHLHPSIELVAVEPPGRASRIHEAPVADLKLFLTALRSAVRLYLDKPWAFFGHCVGGLTLFETARLLLRENLELRHLFISASRPPHRIKREGPFEEQILSFLIREKQYDPLREPHRQPDEVFANMLRYFSMTATDEMLAQSELRSLLLPAIRADFEMAANYRFRREPAWPVPLTCFRGDADPYVTREDTLQWASYTSRDYRAHARPGGHYLLVEDQQFIVQTINQALSG
jgi:surfactin synthase thioesterase subunit/acyl carrier protein